ncbi:pyridoxamine 5'-phosphate oxidase family protein [Pseudoflavonifractor sp. MSJ-37]|uniref:pyridoxamine 5'-phosphate oxidase family protein n=1 Tax=Pseudoflavonifractor sp. MSJ-37 TaxID=2841531 RepID=UPI001C12598C|nr:pyridoxamine 5'-phosphate oxidase family protein [Pseudoflavonifractor sp. MSJ-37]MBU5434568.1 pyridoxamine 5'-phosphate oxidase family protein [Pseudoflavonifractor sp. MSJ-37]
MFRDMRRKRQLLSPEACAAVLEQGTSGVLAVNGDGGFPYAVPLSYVYEGGRLWLHCAKEGHKMDAIRRDPKVSFCVVDQDQIVPEEYTTYFRSVILFGTARILEDEDEVRAAIDALARKYHPAGTQEHRQAAIDRELPLLCVVELQIEHMTGKEAIELVRGK